MNAAARSLVESLAMMGAQGTLVALVALVIARGGRLRPGWQAAVWLVVLVKFVLPWGPALPWSLADLFAALRHHGEGGGMTAIPAGGAIAAPHVSAAWLVVAAAWLTGASIVLARALIAQHRVVRAARRAPPAPGHAQALLASFAGRPPRLVVGDPATGPHVVGLVRPIIVIPPALLDDPALLCPAAAPRARPRPAARRRWPGWSSWSPARCSSSGRWSGSPAAGSTCRARRHATPGRWRSARCRGRPTRGCWSGWRSSRPRPRPAWARPTGSTPGSPRCSGPPRTAGSARCTGWSLVAWIAVALGGARTAAARGEHATCKYTPAFAEALRQLHPEADRDGDGVLSRDEACAFQAELRHRVEQPPGADQVSRLDRTELDAFDETLLTEPLCCNCDRGAEDSAPGAPWIEQRSDTCPSDEGVSR